MGIRRVFPERLSPGIPNVRGLVRLKSGHNCTNLPGLRAVLEAAADALLRLGSIARDRPCGKSLRKKRNPSTEGKGVRLQRNTHTETQSLTTQWDDVPEILA